MLRDPGARFRAVPSLERSLEAFRLADIGLALLAGELADLFRARAAKPAESARSFHATGVVHLTELAVGLTLPWKWDVLVGAYDDAVVQLDAEGRQQVQAAATALMGLVEPREQGELRRFNENRQIVPVVSLRNVGSIQGTSVGLPTLLAMLAARFGLVPRAGVAATGALDAATIPTLPPESSVEARHDRFLDVKIRAVEAIAVKVQAVLEQCPEVQVIVLPRANESDVAGSAELKADVEACGVRLVFAGTVRDLLAADLLEPGLDGPPLRARGSAPAPAKPAEKAVEAEPLVELGGALVLARVIAVGSLLLLALASLGAALG
jgi:hypothetical protein